MSVFSTDTTDTKKPLAWHIYGSNDNSNWEFIDARGKTSITHTSDYEGKRYNAKNWNEIPAVMKKYVYWFDTSKIDATTDAIDWSTESSKTFEINSKNQTKSYSYFKIHFWGHLDGDSYTETYKTKIKSIDYKTSKAPGTHPTITPSFTSANSMEPANKIIEKNNEDVKLKIYSDFVPVINSDTGSKLGGDAVNGGNPINVTSAYKVPYNSYTAVTFKVTRTSNTWILAAHDDAYFKMVMIDIIDTSTFNYKFLSLFIARHQRLLSTGRDYCAYTRRVEWNNQP